MPNTGSVRAFSVDLTKDFSQPGEQALTVLGETVASYGAHPCMVSTDKTGSAVCVANYSGGSIACFKVEHGQVESKIDRMAASMCPDRMFPDEWKDAGWTKTGAPTVHTEAPRGSLGPQIA